MRTRGYGERLIEKICFRNWLRVLGQTWEGDRRPRNLTPRQDAPVPFA
jgi:hypothetical protein